MQAKLHLLCPSLFGLAQPAANLRDNADLPEAAATGIPTAIEPGKGGTCRLPHLARVTLRPLAVRGIDPSDVVPPVRLAEVQAELCESAAEAVSMAAGAGPPTVSPAVLQHGQRTCSTPGVTCCFCASIRACGGSGSLSFSFCLCFSHAIAQRPPLPQAPSPLLQAFSSSANGFRGHGSAPLRWHDTRPATAGIAADGPVGATSASGQPNGGMRVVLLGTGAACPSKYRNVTALYLDFGDRGGMLVDCGEGTWGQLVRCAPSHLHPTRMLVIKAGSRPVWDRDRRHVRAGALAGRTRCGGCASCDASGCRTGMRTTMWAFPASSPYAPACCPPPQRGCPCSGRSRCAAWCRRATR